MATILATGTYFDGLSARPRPVTLRLTERLEIVGEGFRLDWSLLDLRAADTAPRLTRIGHAGGPDSVEFANDELAHALAARCPDLHRAERQGGLTRLVLWSIAAGVSVLLVAVYGVPVTAGLIAPLVPAPIEARLGTTVDAQIVDLLGDPPLCDDAQGRAALDRMLARLTGGTDLPAPLQVSVRRSAMANALTLPGGRVIVLSDLIAKAKSADEFAGVIAHEIGHVAARDPTRSVITAGGTSFLLSLVLGDLTGSTVIVAVAQAAISAGYSRDAERAADAYAVEMMARAGGDPAALATILERITHEHDETPDATAFLRSHPFTAERAATIRAMARKAVGGTNPAPGGIMPEADWEALRRICPPKAEPDAKPDAKPRKKI